MLISMGRKLIDLTGKRFGTLIVNSRAENSAGGATRWECTCDCGVEKLFFSSHLIRGNTKSCGCNKPKGENHSSWRGCGELSGDFMDSIRRGADGHKGKRAAVEFSVSVEYLWDLFLSQDRSCALSGIPLIMLKEGRTASLDRIDSKAGYTKKNVQWVHKDVNLMKNRFGQDYFVEMCRRVAGVEFGAIDPAFDRGFYSKRGGGKKIFTQAHKDNIQNGNAKLTKEEVLEIRELLRLGDVTKTFIADKFGVSMRNVRCIELRKTWKNI